MSDEGVEASLVYLTVKKSGRGRAIVNIQFISTTSSDKNYVFSTADCQASATKISRGDFQLSHFRGLSLIISPIASNCACVSLWKS